MEHITFFIKKNAELLGIDFYSFIIKILEKKIQPFYDYIKHGGTEIYQEIIKELENDIIKLEKDKEDRIVLIKLLEEEMTQSKSNYYKETKILQNKDIAEYYASLEISYDSNIDQVKKAYRGLLQKFHPDKFPNDKEKNELAVKLTQELNKAYRKICEFLENNK